MPRAKLPIVQYWHSEDVPAEVADSTATFRDRNPDLQHMLFSEAEADDFIAEHFTDREVAAFRACAVPAMQADYFRYCAILTLGGTYTDVGFRCLRPLQTLIDTIDGGLLFGKQQPHRVIYNGLFAFTEPGHPLLRLVLDVATANIERRTAETVNLTTGPWIFTCLAEMHRCGSFEIARRQAPTPMFEGLADRMHEAVEDYARVEAAFKGVRIEPFSLATDWIGTPETPLQYKESDTHWIDWPRRKGGIFR